MNGSCEAVKIFASVPTMEGAGVKLRRGIGVSEAPSFDPFLLFDDFSGEDPADYVAGFPWHPHRGIETVTYLIRGDVEHGDSIGNSGSIGPGQVQWMTAGGGVIHQEMPQPVEGGMVGFQLWVNLPAKDKLMAPRYRDITADQIPTVEVDGGSVKVIAGRFRGVEGPVREIVRSPWYFDVTVEAGRFLTLDIPTDFFTFLYIFEGEGRIGESGSNVASKHIVKLSGGDHLKILGGSDGMRFLLMSGEPIGEPVAWRGPIVMNTEEELELAFYEFRNGTFIKKGKNYT
ncbi:MAG: hypothetical protein C0609_07540 [Deltaproteobacteria bacterium]|nr:MAG: hypothetical protein C0609_07540 [Deltaproteobacteria bacterium]